MALMDNRTSSTQDDSNKETIQGAKWAADKGAAGASKLVSHHNNSILRNNEKAANSQLHTAGDKRNKLKNYQSSALKVDGQHRGNERQVAKFMSGEQKIENNSLKIDKIESKLNKTMKNRYYRDYQIKGGIRSPLRMETSMKSKLRPTTLEKNAGKLGHLAKGSLSEASSKLDSDELGIQKAWVDATDKTVGAAATVYKVSKTAKYWRNMRNEINAAALLRKEERLMKSTFRTEYREAFNLFKASDVGKSANFYEKQKYKKFLKKKYMKNAMKQYREAKKVGNASKTVFSTGLSFKDTLAKAGNSLVEVFKALLSKKATWIVLLCGACIMLLPVIFSVFINLFVSLFGSSAAQESQQANASMPEEVLQWREFVVERCEANNDTSSATDLNQFVNAILTTIWQESGGVPETCDGDIMQCKACGLWDDSAMPSDWSEAQKSIDVGIRYFYGGLKSWGVTDPQDYDGLQVVAQGYNYGFAFLTWMKDKGETKWTQELSAEYSAKMCEQSGWSSYGHIPYGEEWLEKYKGASAGSGEVVEEKGVEGVVMTALNQEGITENPSGTNNVVFNTDFYGREVCDGEPTAESKYPWCCAFVWWCFEKSGNGDLVPKTAGCSYMQDHISEYGGRKLSNVYEAKRGDLVIFRGGEHIGIVVENKGGGNLVTIEGNTTPENGTGSDYNGGCVAKRNRNISSDSITAVLRPDYDED